MSTPRQWNEPVVISENGDRIVVETTYATGERCQMIFVRTLGGWTLTLCAPGVPAIDLSTEAATALAYGLRQTPGN